MVLVQVQQFGTGTRYELEILHQCGKRVKTKSQFWGLIPTFAEVKEEKLQQTGKSSKRSKHEHLLTQQKIIKSINN